MPGVLGAGIRRGVHVRLVERQEIGFVAIASRRGGPIVSGRLDARPWVAVDRVAVPIAIRLKEDAAGSGKGDNTRICNSGGILIVRLVNGRDIGRITRRGGPAEFIREEKQAVALIIFTLQEAGVLDTVYRRCLSFVQQVFPFFPGRNPAGAGSGFRGSGHGKPGRYMLSLMNCTSYSFPAARACRQTSCWTAQVSWQGRLFAALSWSASLQGMPGETAEQHQREVL